MSGLVFNGYDFGEACKAKTLSVSPLRVRVDDEGYPLVAGMKAIPDALDVRTIKVKLMLDAGRKLDCAAAASLRRKVDGMLAAPRPSVLRLPEDDVLEYRDAMLTDAGTWVGFREDGEVTLTFTAFDPIAYGAMRRVPDCAFEVGGTWKTYPTYELVAAEGDSVMVIDEAHERFICVLHSFAGGERVVVDCEREVATIDGVDASADIAIASDFFALDVGRHELAFAGCSEHVVNYVERWA